jgi:hypothetical protein
VLNAVVEMPQVGNYYGYGYGYDSSKK